MAGVVWPFSVARKKNHLGSDNATPCGIDRDCPICSSDARSFAVSSISNFLGRPFAFAMYRMTSKV